MLIEIVLEFPHEFLFPHWTRYKERQRKAVWLRTWHTFLYPWRQSIRKEKNNIFQWPWHLILMQKRKGMTAFEAESMKFLYISYDLVSLSPTRSRFLYRDSCIWASSAPAMPLMTQWKVSNRSIISSISRLFYPQSPKTCFFWWNKQCFHFSWIELKIYLMTKWIRVDRESNS